MSNKEIWDEYNKNKKIYIDNRIYIRHGWCKRCGACCYEYHRDDNGIKKRGKPCRHLIINDNGTTACDIYEDRNQSCKDFPLLPTSVRDLDNFKDCGYYWIIDSSLTIEEALRRHKNVCAICDHSKIDCEQRSKVRNEILEKCKQ